jgi:hypothetical protein
VLIYEIRVYQAADTLLKNEMVSVLPAAIAGLPPG